MLELHVWGPVFGLPSIDAECIAAITYIHNASPDSAWRIIPSNDASVCPASMYLILHLTSLECLLSHFPRFHNYNAAHAPSLPLT